MPVARPLTTISLLILLCGLRVPAADPSRAAKVEEILQLTGGAQTVTALVDSVNRLDAAARKKAGSAAGQDARLAGLASRAAKLKADMIQAYTDVFTGEEIDGMLAFYRSPAGRAMVRKYPQLMVRVKALAGEQRLLDEEIRKMVEALKSAE